MFTNKVCTYTRARIDVQMIRVSCPTRTHVLKGYAYHGIRARMFLRHSCCECDALNVTCLAKGVSTLTPRMLRLQRSKMRILMILQHKASVRRATQNGRLLHWRSLLAASLLEIAKSNDDWRLARLQLHPRLLPCFKAAGS